MTQKVLWPSGLRRRVKAAVFGRGFKPHQYQLVFFVFTLFSNEVSKPRNQFASRPRILRPHDTLPSYRRSRQTISRTLSTAIQKARRPLKNQTTQFFKSYFIITRLKRLNDFLLTTSRSSNLLSFHFNQNSKTVVLIEPEVFSTCSCVFVVQHQFPKDGCSLTVTLALTITLFGLYEFYDASGSIK